MLGAYLVSFFVAIIIVVYWARANDSVPLTGLTKGFLRMKFTQKTGPGAPDDAAAGTTDAAPQAPAKTDPASVPRFRS